eukprot:m.203902 g.203902  ORF g.203902 m.203902 type:complete len:66 (+) comp25294_c0_seq4:359-556(+)
MYRESGMRHRRLPVVAVFFFSCAAVNGSVAYMLWGERGVKTKQWFIETVGLPANTTGTAANTPSK